MMCKNIFDQIADGRQETLAYLEDKKTDGKTRQVEPLHVAQIRENLGLSQAEFAMKSVLAWRPYEIGSKVVGSLAARLARTFE